MSKEFKELIFLLDEDPDSAYDYVANNYWKMTKDELKSICLEALFAIYYCLTDDDDEAACYRCMFEELHDTYLV